MAGAVVVNDGITDGVGRITGVGKTRHVVYGALSGDGVDGRHSSLDQLRTEGVDGENKDRDRQNDIDIKRAGFFLHIFIFNIDKNYFDFVINYGNKQYALTPPEV